MKIATWNLQRLDKNKNQIIIDKLVDILIEKETISGNEFRSLVAEYTLLPEKISYTSQL